MAIDWASASGASGSRRISLILPHERTWRRIRLCQFCTLIDIVTKTAIVSFRKNTARLLSTANNILDFFAHAVLPLILYHGTGFKFSTSGLKILHS